jgi:hypothetical protein
MGQRLERLQTLAATSAVAGLLLGFLASIGLRLFPALSAAGFWVVAVLLLAAGVGGGLATVARAREIDRRRWEIVEDPMLTSGEREYAHKEAERARRWAGTAFLTAPVALAYWAAYQVTPEAALGAPPLLAAVPLAGYLAGLVSAHLAQRRARPE